LGFYYFFSKWLLFKRQMRNFSAISWREQVTFQWNDNDVHVLLNQNSWIFIVLAHRNNCPVVDVIQLRLIILISSQPVFALSP
jgi:hypothetical protein